jgi:serine protease Do/serine protease DegQ
MKLKSLSCLFFMSAAAGLLAVITLAGTAEERMALDLPVDRTPIERVAAPTPTSFAPMLKKTTPSVVAVYTSEIVRVVQSQGSREEELLRRLFGLPLPDRRGVPEPEIEERRVPQGTGSGVIVSEEGYILTNNHVVIDQQGEDADEILVRLNDGRELSAEIIGRDPKTDVAVLKVNAPGLPALKLADSDRIEVGDVVFAIGNPMGVGTTVTQGIVSARDRAIGIYGREGYENFIQTDAAINVGNSGGALVDTNGRLIGINSAILSRSGGSIGIGFAIPSNLVVSVTRQLTEFGEVKRGFLGVSISDVTPDMAEAFGLDKAQGVLIDDVEEGLAAEKAGLRRGDIVTSVNDKAVRNINELRVRVGQIPPGTEVRIGTVRDGKKKTVSATIGDRAQKIGGVGNELVEGITVAILDDGHRKRFGIPDNIDGLVVTEAEADSPYARYLTPGVVLLEINDQRIRGISDARSALRRGANKLYVYDRGRAGYLALRTR